MALSNPSMIANAVVESVPVMGMGGVMGRAGLAAGRGIGRHCPWPTTAAQAAARQTAFSGAAGEGVSASAGSQAEAIRQETADGLLTPTQSGAAALTGVIGTAVGQVAWRLARYLGIGDADTMLAQGARRYGQSSLPTMRQPLLSTLAPGANDQEHPAQDDRRGHHRRLP